MYKMLEIANGSNCCWVWGDAAANRLKRRVGDRCEYIINKFYYIYKCREMAYGVTAIGFEVSWPVTCEQQNDVYLYILFPTWPTPWTKGWAPVVACSINALVAIYQPIYYVSHALRIFFSRTRLEQHCTRRTDTHKLDVCGVRDRLTCRAMGHLQQRNSIFLANASLCTSRVYNKFG